MKHRSVIAFVIVAAALFSLPQLSHDLQALKGAVGTRLHNGLLHAFLNLPAGDPVAAAPVARPAEMLLASCPQQAKPAAKPFKAERIEGRGKSEAQSAMIGDPAHDPINQVASAVINRAADKLVAVLPEMKVETEIAMIIPPEYAIDPRAAVSALGAKDASRITADRLRANAEGLRLAYTTAARFQNNVELQKATEEVFQKLDGSLPGGTYEFRVVRDGVKTKVLKRCNECPATAPRLPPAPRRVPVAALPLAPSAPVEWASE